MYKSQNIPELMDLAASQWGLFTSAQALALGVSRTQVSRMAADGRVERAARGTWHVTAAGYDEHLGARAAWLSLFPKKTAWERFKTRPYDAVATGRTAAFLHGDAELHAEPYTFTVGPGKRTTRNDVRLCAWAVDGRDVEIVGGLPCATVERTVADLVRLREDPSLVDGFVRGAASRGLRFDEGRLAELLAPLAARNGFVRRDGATFARDIYERDVLPQSASRALSELKAALSPYQSQAIAENLAPAMLTLGEAMRFIENQLHDTQAAEKALESLSETLAQTNDRDVSEAAKDAEVQDGRHA